MLYRMIVRCENGEVFMTAEVSRVMIARMAHFFAWAKSECRLYGSWDGERWRFIPFIFSAKPPRNT